MVSHAVELGRLLDYRCVPERPSPSGCDREIVRFCLVRCWMHRRAAGCWLVGRGSVLVRWLEHGEKELDSGLVEGLVGLEEA
jgi:hypothetical protein